MYVCMYVCGGVANVFYQSCAQIDNNQQVYEVQIQVPKCNNILKAGVKSSVHFILIDVRMSTQTTDPRQLTLHNVCVLFSSWV
jgi:saccharopine dehydrogenase-like NADP-dependent oxidoreductase